MTQKRKLLAERLTGPEMKKTQASSAPGRLSLGSKSGHGRVVPSWCGPTTRAGPSAITLCEDSPQKIVATTQETDT